jgi:hypothetical protein
MPYSVTTITGVPRTRRRGIGFLESSDNGRVNAKRYFDKLKEKTARDVRSRFDYWLQGGVFDKYFHGWPNDREPKHCFVFKWKEAGAHHRLYGFLCDPAVSQSSLPGLYPRIPRAEEYGRDGPFTVECSERIENPGRSRRGSDGGIPRQ